MGVNLRAFCTVQSHPWHLAHRAPQDLKQDILLPVPKKGDASLCSNYRTIALQSIAGKAYANVLSARLSEWLADYLLHLRLHLEH